MRLLGDAVTELGAYQGSAYGVRRGWAKANEKTMVSFIQSIVEAHDTIFTNKADAIAVLKGRIKGLNDKEADIIYSSLTDPNKYIDLSYDEKATNGMK